MDIAQMSGTCAEWAALGNEREQMGCSWLNSNAVHLQYANFKGLHNVGQSEASPLSIWLAGHFKNKFSKKSRCVMGIHLNNSKTILFGKLSHLHFSKTTNKPKTFLEARLYGNGENAKIWGWVEAAAGDGGGLGGVVGTLVSLCPYDRSLSRLPPSSSSSRSCWWKDGSF